VFTATADKGHGGYTLYTFRPPADGDYGDCETSISAKVALTEKLGGFAETVLSQSPKSPATTRHDGQHTLKPDTAADDDGDALEYAARLESDGMPRAEAEALAGITS